MPPVNDDLCQRLGDGAGCAGADDDLSKQVGRKEFQQEHGHGADHAADHQAGLSHGADAGAKEALQHVHPLHQTYQNGGKDHTESGVQTLVDDKNNECQGNQKQQ